MLIAKGRPIMGRRFTIYSAFLDIKNYEAPFYGVFIISLYQDFISLYQEMLNE